MGDLRDKNAGKWLSWTTLNQYQRDQLVDSPTFTTNFLDISRLLFELHLVAHGPVWKDWACNVKLQRCSNVFILDCYWVQRSHCLSSSLKRGSVSAQMYDPINIQEYLGCNQTDGHILLTKITLLYNFS